MFEKQKPCITQLCEFPMRQTGLPVVRARKGFLESVRCIQCLPSPTLILDSSLGRYVSIILSLPRQIILRRKKANLRPLDDVDHSVYN
jgi:hypothetical protein